MLLSHHCPKMWPIVKTKDVEMKYIKGEIAKYVQMHQLTEMKNPFLNISSYFLDIKDGKVYEVTNYGSIPPYFKHVTDPRALKSLKDASC